MKRVIMRILPVTTPVVVATLLYVSGCSDDESGPTAPPPPGSVHKKIVQMKDNFFEPKDVTISRGDTIVWFNVGAAIHTSTSGAPGSADGWWDSGNLGNGEMFQRVFDDTTGGPFDYFCIPHSHLGMVGTVTVDP
jgi:plastocyanin